MFLCNMPITRVSIDNFPISYKASIETFRCTEFWRKLIKFAAVFTLTTSNLTLIGYYPYYVNSSPLNWKQYRFVSEETKQKTWAHFGKNKTIRPHVTLVRAYECNSLLRFLWRSEFEIKLDQDKFKLKVDRSAKTSWQEYGVVGGFWWWAPGAD